MTKSYLVLVMLLMLLVVAVAASVRRCAPPSGLAPSPSGVSTDPSPPPEGRSSIVASQAVTPTASAAGAPPASLPRQGASTGGQVGSLERGAVGGGGSAGAAPLAQTEGIDGLVLRLSRPVSLQGLVQGLAVGSDGVFCSVTDPTGGQSFLYKLRRDMLTVAQVKAVGGDAPTRPGGLYLGDRHLWLPLVHWPASGAAQGATGQRSTQVLAVDPGTLQTVSSFPVLDVIVLVVEIPGGNLIGLNGEGTRAYEWTPDGREVRRREVATGAVYGDAELVNGVLVCAGSDANGGVLDVMDPESLTLLARHRCWSRAADGSFVSEGGLGFAWDALAAHGAGGAGAEGGAVFYLLSPGSRFPALQSYVLADVPLALWAPGRG